MRVVRSLVYPAPNRGFARRLADHAVFAAGALAASPAAGPVDVVVAETPPLFTAAAGVAYARLKGAQLALNVSDLWPESAIELGALSEGGRSCSRRGGARAALLPGRTADHRAHRGIVETLLGSGGYGSSGKVVHVPPAVDLERFASLPPPAPRPGAPLRVLYAGNLGLSQGLGDLLQAAALAGPEVVELLIAGEGAEEERLRALVHTRGLAHVRMLGPVPAREIPTLYGSVDAGVVPLRDLPIFAGALPTKLFEVLAAGRPVILAARGEAAAAGAGCRSGPRRRTRGPPCAGRRLPPPARLPRGRPPDGRQWPPPRPPLRSPRSGRAVARAAREPQELDGRPPVSASCCKPVSSGSWASASR